MTALVESPLEAKLAAAAEELHQEEMKALAAEKAAAIEAAHRAKLEKERLAAEAEAEKAAADEKAAAEAVGEAPTADQGKVEGKDVGDAHQTGQQEVPPTPNAEKPEENKAAKVEE